MQKFNYHTHTYRCGHAEVISDEEFVKTFIEKGFTKIAFTDHCPEKKVIDTREKMRMKYDERLDYLNSIKLLKEKYKDVIEIESGYEIEYLPGEEENLFELKNETDKLVLGQHFIYDNEGKLKCFRKSIFNDEDILKYADYIKTAILKNIPDIIVHPDLYMLARSEFGEAEAKAAHIICSTAEKYSIPLEINLSQPHMYSKGKLDEIKYPSKEFWKIASTYNVKVIYGIDAHFKDQINSYEKSMEIANNHIGYDVIEKLHFCNEKEV